MARRKSRRKKATKKEKLIILAACAAVVLAGVGGFAAYRVYQASQEPKEADPQEQEEAYQAMAAEAVDVGDDPYESKVDFDALWEINPDVCAWITVPGTNIDYPILRNAEKEDNYYLNTTIDGQSGLPGSIYMEKYNAEDFSDNVTVLYGHTYKAGTMFSELKKYKDREFFDENRYVYIYLPDKALKYVIFSAVAFDNRYILGNYSFYAEEDFNSYIAELNASMEGNVDEDIEIPFGARVLTLSTCITGVPTQRWLVNAVLLATEE